MNYYSQNGEDMVLWSLFEDKKNGFFIDIGALDGKVFSNTFSFEEAGWSGICVEAHPAYIGVLKKNRRNSQCIHAAISNKNKKSTTFYSHIRGALSTLDGNMEKVFSKRFKKYFTGFNTVSVRMMTINALLEEVGISRKIDVVSIDIEGSELAAIMGFDLKKYTPRVLVIEALDKNREKALDNYMRRNEYILARVISNNRFYCKSYSDKKTLMSAKINRNKLIISKHPLDTGEVKIL